MPLLAQYIVAGAVGYLLGSIPSAYLAGRVILGRDIRRLGDGNVGAENAFFHLGKKAGVAVGVTDIAKGSAAVLIFRAAGFEQGPWLISGFLSVVGHIWPVFLRFRGGRGAATTIGVLIVALFPASAVAFLAIPMLLARKGTLAAAAVVFIVLQPVVWTVGYSASQVVYALGLPIMVGLVHFYQVMLPAYQRTGRIHLRPRE